MANRVVRVSRQLGSNTVLPERLENSVVTTMDMYYPAGRLTAAAGNYFAVMVNSIASPFNVPTFTATLTTASYSFANYANLIQGNSITDSPMGYSTMGGLYTKYAVLRYRLEVTAIPGSTTDAARMVVLPIGNEEIPSTGASSVNLRVLEEQPFALATTVASATDVGPASGNTLVLSGCPYKDLGVDRSTYLSDATVSMNSQPATAYRSYAGIFLQELNGSNSTVAFSLQVKLTQIVQWSDLIQQVN